MFPDRMRLALPLVALLARLAASEALVEPQGEEGLVRAAAASEEGATAALATDDQCSAAAADDARGSAAGCALSALQRRGLAVARQLTPPMASKRVMKGMCYSPVPLRSVGSLPNDDLSTVNATGMWGTPRNDLEIIRRLGANTVRLYGDEPAASHKPFLDRAHQLGLEVVLGTSDFPYIQAPDNCRFSHWNCYEQIKRNYSLNLREGRLAENGAYNPAMKRVIVINEPDLKAPGIATPRDFCKTIISALDGMLDAEKEVGVTRNLVSFTATFSFAICTQCSDFRDKPGLGQMAELRRAMRNPESYGYRARNDLWKVYQTRFENSFNTANPAKDLRPMFLDAYEQAFEPSVFIGEYHKPQLKGHDLTDDLEEALDVAASSSKLLGINFFEYQVAQWKGGLEEDFGLFRLGNRQLGEVILGNPRQGSKTFTIWCLNAVGEEPKAVATAYQGSGVPASMLC